MTPLVDVVFLLIVFFVLVAQFTRAQRVAMDLPTARGSAALARDDRPVVVNLTQQPGREYVCVIAGEAFALDDAGMNAAAQRIGALLRERSEGRSLAALRAPATAPISVVAPILEALRRSGAERVALATRGEHD